MITITEPDFIRALAERGVTVNKSQANQFRPVAAARGDCEQIGSGVRCTWLWKSEAVEVWAVYLRTRDELIAAGKWNSKREYALEDVHFVVYGELPQGQDTPTGTAECPRCKGYGKIAQVIDWQTQAEPCPRCEENGYIPISDLTPRERSSWYQREYRKRKKQQTALDEQERLNDEADALWEAGGYYGR